MLQDIRKGLIASLGAVVLTREKIDAQKLVDELYQAGERQWGDFEKIFKDAVRAAMESLDIGSSNDLKLLKARLDNIEKRLTLLEEIGYAHKEKGIYS